MQVEYSESKYFMTTKDQDAVLGQVMRERQLLEVRRAALEAEATRLSDTLLRRGKALRHPGKVALETEGLSEDFDSAVNPADRITQSDLEVGSSVLTLAREFRGTIAKLKEA